MATSVVRLTHLTDPHLYGGERELLRGIATLPSLEAALANARQRDWPPDAVLVTGDLVQDDPAGYVHFKRLLGELRVPVLCLPGNHDEPEAMRRELDGAPFVIGGAVDLGLWRIVLLDSTISGSAAGRVSAGGLAALESALAAAPQRHALVCLHHHPVPMDSRWLDRVGLQNGAEFFDVIDRHPNVRGIVWGHVHQSYDAVRKGVRLLATPSTCAQFLPHSNEFAVNGRPPAYRWLALQPDGTLETEVVWVDEAAGELDSASGASA